MRVKVKGINNYIFPLLFSIALTYWTISSFFGVAIFGTLMITIVLQSILFSGYAYLKKKGKLGGLFFILASIPYIIITVIILSIPSLSSGANYFTWVKATRPDSINFIFEFWLGTILLTSYGFSSTVFYFTTIRFRLSLLFLIGIAPFMFESAKSSEGISLPFIIYVILFFLLYVERTRKKSGNESSQDHIGNRWYLVSISIFISITLFLSLIAPKPTRIPKIVYLDAVLSQAISPLGAAVQNAIQGQNNFLLFNPTNIRKESYIDSISVPLGDRVLFEVEADEPLYFRIQSWDKYEKNKWKVGNKLLNNCPPFEEYVRRASKLELMVNLMDRINQAGLLKSEFNDFSDVLKYPSVQRINKKATVIPNNFPMRSFLNISTMTDIKMGKGNLAASLSESGSCFLNKNASQSSYEKYTISYVSQEMASRSKQFQALRKWKKDDIESLMNPDNFNIRRDSGSLTKEDGILNISEEENSILLSAQNEMEIAYENYTGLPDDLPNRINDLAQKLTEKMPNDYAKALAIEQFFHSSGFKYDLKAPSLPKDKDYNDFFIFESKRGVCVHFASAMVLLARSAGLPARYVEGYVAKEKDPETGRYLIREKYAHAFPEVYIAGYGWMTFEPTVSAEESENQFITFFNSIAKGINNFATDVAILFKVLPLWAKVSFIPLFIFIFFLMFSFFFRIRRIAWKKRVIRIDRSQALGEIFLKVSSLLKRVNLDIKKHETPSKYARRICGECGILLTNLTDVFNKLKYGGIEPSQQDVTRALEIYNEVEAHVKERVGKLKAWMI